MSLRKRLLQDNDSLAIFGGGYVGYSDAAFYAKHGVESLIVDLDSVKVEKINRGQPPYPEIGPWLGFDLKPFTKLIHATTDWHEVLEENYPVHIVAVNTEKDGNTWDEPLKDVCSKIARAKQTPLTIIESTLTPGWTDSIIIPTLGLWKPVAVAPRRDWFTLPGMSLETLDRVVGATSEGALNEAVSVLGIVSQKIHKASSYKVAEMVKSVENAYRHIGISFAYQLSLAYPHMDVREVLKLAATKFNMDLYFPSIGIAGFCVPLGPEYVLGGAEDESPLSLLKEAEKANWNMPKIIAQKLAGGNYKKISILGIAYKGNLKVHVASASIRLAKELKTLSIEPVVNDPLYTDEEIRKLTGCEPVQFPEGLKGCDCVVVACDHDQYKSMPKTLFYDSLSSCRLILDSFALWSPLRDRFKAMSIDYHAIGDSGWLI